jgi:hypothetical protein
MKSFAALIACAALALTGVAEAQTPAAAPISPRKLELARAIFEAQGGKANLEASIRAYNDQVRATLPADASPQRAQALREAADEETSAILPALVDQIAQIYATELTEPQLSDLLKFHQSATGQALRQKDSEISRRQAQAFGPLIAQISYGMMQRFCAKTACSEAEQQQLAAAGARLHAQPAAKP